MKDSFDVAVIGAGIVGLAHAWMACRHGLRVVLFERSSVAQGASVRNFGMIWPIGQRAGHHYELALRSRELWLELAGQGVLDVVCCGSIHLAHRQDELNVLQEFCDQATHNCVLLRPSEVMDRTTFANSDGLLGGMLSPTEMRVDPRTASSRIASWLQSENDVACHFNTTITRVEEGTIHSADNRQWTAKRIIVCSGSDLMTLYPELFRDSGLKRCKLQMLKSTAQPNPTKSSPHLASGLTLRHYTSFENCPSHAELCRRIADETPELDRYGIHVMASPFPSGEVVLGDSHEYGDDITPFDKAEIDELILRELHKVVNLPDWRITERWHGVYTKHPTLPVFEKDGNHGVHIFVGTGGAGMTMSFGLAERAWNRWG